MLETHVSLKIHTHTHIYLYLYLYLDPDISSLFVSKLSFDRVISDMLIKTEPQGCNQQTQVQVMV